jgi:S1-C subfamily serine protease
VLIGDILIAMADTSIESAEDLQQYSDSGVIGKNVTAKFVRGGAVKDLSLAIGERPRRQG